MYSKFLLLTTVVLLTGCDQAAIELARQTGVLLTEYQTNINNQISQATGYYNRDVDIARRAERRQLNDSLGAEREERSTELAADYLDGRKPVSLYRTDIRGYGQTEHETRKKTYEAAVDVSLPYERQLAKLEADRETVEALGKALDALQQKRSLRTEGEDLKGFVNETKKDFSAMVCADLSSRKTARDKQSGAIARLFADRKCDDIKGGQ